MGVESIKGVWYTLVPRLFPPRRERAWYILSCVWRQGRHDLISRGWTKLGAHARSNTSVFKTTTAFFSGKYSFNVLPLSLQSALYSCPRITSRFLEAVAATRTTMTLAYNTTNHEISCHSARQVLCLMLWESTTPVHLAIYGFTAAVAGGFCAIVATCVYLPRSRARVMWVCAHVQLSHVYLASTLDVKGMLHYRYGGCVPDCSWLFSVSLNISTL